MKEDSSIQIAKHRAHCIHGKNPFFLLCDSQELQLQITAPLSTVTVVMNHLQALNVYFNTASQLRASSCPAAPCPSPCAHMRHACKLLWEALSIPGTRSPIPQLLSGRRKALPKPHLVPLQLKANGGWKLQRLERGLITELQWNVIQLITVTVGKEIVCSEHA